MNILRFARMRKASPPSRWKAPQRSFARMRKASPHSRLKAPPRMFARMRIASPPLRSDTPPICQRTSSRQFPALEKRPEDTEKRTGNIPANCIRCDMWVISLTLLDMFSCILQKVPKKSQSELFEPVWVVLRNTFLRSVTFFSIWQ